MPTKLSVERRCAARVRDERHVDVGYAVEGLERDLLDGRGANTR